MAAILNGFLPVRRRDQYVQERILNTRWGDAAISAPIHGGWNDNPTLQQESPDLDRDLPPTPPQAQEEQEDIYIVQDEAEQEEQDWGYGESDRVRDNFTITIPLPWKKKVKQTRRTSMTNVLKPRTSPLPQGEVIPTLATLEAAAVPLADSRVNSPIGRSTATSPVLSFRSRLASPNLGDMLSPVAEGFAKEGPSSNSGPMPVLSSLQFSQVPPTARPSTASSTRSNLQRRASLTSQHSDGIGAGTMSSQVVLGEQVPEMHRPPSRGTGTTAGMRASSRGPRSTSREPRATSVERFGHRAGSVEPIWPKRSTSIEAVSQVHTEQMAEAESMYRNVLDLEPVRRRAPSIEPLRRRAPSIEPVSRRAPSADPVGRRAPSADPISTRRARSKDARGRRGLSIEPRPRVRFHSEAAPTTMTRRHDSFSSNDGSVESEDDTRLPVDGLKSLPNTVRFDRELQTSRKPLRRRSIASPITSPTVAAFSVTRPVEFQPTYTGTAISLPSSGPQRNAPRDRSKSRTRGLYNDMHDDFRLLARDVAMSSTTAATTISPAITMASPVLPHSQQSSDSSSFRTTSPALTSHPPISFASGIAAAAALRLQPEPQGYSSDSSLTALPSVSNAGHPQPPVPQADTAAGKASLAAMARERKDQLRREERERAREKVARKLEMERERAMAHSVFSDTESTASGSVSGSEKTRRVYGGSVGSETEWKHIIKGKILVPNAEDIWG